jgi:cation transport ATPase
MTLMVVASPCALVISIPAALLSALATARLGVAMGAAGTDVALESADALLMGDDLSRLPEALHLAGRARRIVRQNLCT